MRAYERLLKYAQYDTASDESSKTCPSTASQLVLAKDLAEEMVSIGLSDVRVDENGYVYGCVPANVEGRPVIGLIAHMDTVNTVPVLPMNTSIIENYDGGVVQLACGDVLDPAVFPDLARAKGQDLIVTDGVTLLGADDKAGIAEILTLCERLIANPDIPHGKVMIGFTPDEEIGRGANLFDIPAFGADFAYTVDGSVVGGIEYECFNGASGMVTIHGRSVHPGSAKNKMLNAALVAMEFASMLPADQTPAHTEGYEGFFHLCGIKGEEEQCQMVYIIRDHDLEKLRAKMALFQSVADFLNAKYGSGVVEVDVKESYYNMRSVIEPHMHIVRLAERAYRAIGIEPFNVAIRGGTDGAALSFKGLPCPNLPTGGMNCHGRFEYITIQDMDKMVDMLEKLVSIKPEGAR